MIKTIIISDKNSKSAKIKKQMLKIFKRQPLKRSNIIIVIGGDGFMLKTLKSWYNYFLEQIFLNL